MTAATSASTDTLRQLLGALDRDPAELAEALRAAREAMVEDVGDQAELDIAELEFLRRRARDPRLAPAIAASTARARRSALRVRLRTVIAAPPGDCEAWFELAEVRAELRLLDMAEELELATSERQRRLTERIDHVKRLAFAAKERWVELSTEEEDLSLRQKITLLQEYGDVCSILADKTGDRTLRRLARRARNASVDRTVQARVERVLTPTGAIVLETTSLVLLLVVFVLIAIQLWHGDRPWIRYLDFAISAFFIVEFLFKLALAPRRLGWFLRNFVTDLLPALPAAILFLEVPGQDAAGGARALRFLRVVWLARTVRALQPVIAVVRMFLFLVRGFDTVVRRFSRLLNRDFVFFERHVLPLPQEHHQEPMTLAFRALRREHVLLAELPPERSAEVMTTRALALESRLLARQDLVIRDRRTKVLLGVREVPVEHAIEYLWRVQPPELPTYLTRREILSLDRVIRILNSRPVRWLPILRSVRSPRMLPSAEERVVDFGRRVGLLLELWRERALRFADLHGIVTGPQVLDRVASAIVKASQRPAVRLLLFGGLFTLVKMILGADSSLGGFLARFVATPLVILGGACLVFLALGRWLKSLAGEAADAFALTSEVHFLNLTELLKQRQEHDDVYYLAKRIYRDELDAWRAAGKITAYLNALRTGRAEAVPAIDDLALEARIQRTALLYLDFLDGAPLHRKDIQTTEQLLANLSLQNIRSAWLQTSRKDRKRLRSLSLVEGSLFRGPYVWFQFVAESIAVETAKLLTDWNRNCLTCARRRAAGAEERKRFSAWLRHRRTRESVRSERTAPPSGKEQFQTTEFHALDFLSLDPVRRQHLVRRFGRGVVRLLERDRECMIREVFGMRPLHALPRSERTVNFYRFWENRLSRGRVLFAPLFAIKLLWVGLRETIGRVVRIVREILAPQSAARKQERGRAPFAVALRKIHRMKAPGLLEIMRLRASVDPAYVGAPSGWSGQPRFDERSELERDMDFLELREREREELRELSARLRSRTEELHAWILGSPVASSAAPAEMRHRMEIALTIAWVTDRDHVRTLSRAREWLERIVPNAESRETRLPTYFGRRSIAFLLRLGTAHPVDRWIRKHLAERRISRRGRGNLKRMWHRGDREMREVVTAWSELLAGAPPDAIARERCERLADQADEIVRDLSALRAVQTMAVLDIRNYRSLVFDLGGYAKEGESDRIARVLP
jgi:hypothetical protein